MNDKKVRSLIVRLGSENTMVQFNAACALGRIRSPQAVPALIEALDDKAHDEFIQRHIIEALVAIKDPQAVPALIRALQNKNALVQIKAVEALGAWKSREAVPALIAALKDQASAVTQSMADDSGSSTPLVTQWVCNEAAFALGRIGDAHAIPALSEVLQDKRYDIRTCGCAVRALGSIGGPLAVHPLVEALDNAAYAKEAVRALAMIGPTAFPTLLEALSREKVRSLTIPALIKVVQSDEYLLPRCRAAELLKAIAAHQPDPALRAALPVLRWNNRRNNWRHQNPVFQKAVDQIEAATAGFKDLPLPAAALPLDTQTLPRPVAVPLGVSVTPQGFWTRLHRRLKGS